MADGCYFMRTADRKLTVSTGVILMFSELESTNIEPFAFYHK
jgi:hypothetical protein